MQNELSKPLVQDCQLFDFVLSQKKHTQTQYNLGQVLYL